MLEQKNRYEVEVRQIDNHGTITARDNNELTRNFSKCVGVERLCEGVKKVPRYTYISYRKPRAISTEQREWARQMMIAKNKEKGD